MDSTTTALKLTCIVGTRPECLKLASVIRALPCYPGIAGHVVSSGQHPHMVSSTLEHLGLPLHTALPALPGG
ncbi:MAG TPA: hypothetical protein VMH83_12160, partial [Candidatus Acidoferrum sp.]|nr:hypothetical protein [Candidatus Acidoferrum sp.]